MVAAAHSGYVSSSYPAALSSFGLLCAGLMVSKQDRLSVPLLAFTEFHTFCVPAMLAFSTRIAMRIHDMLMHQTTKLLFLLIPASLVACDGTFL